MRSRRSFSDVREKITREQLATSAELADEMLASIEALNTRLAEIKAQPYTRSIVRESDGSWFAQIVEFPGCVAVGETREDAESVLDDAMLTFVKTSLMDGRPIPRAKPKRIG